MRTPNRQCEEAHVEKGSMKARSLPYHMLHAPVLRTKHTVISLRKKDGGGQALMCGLRSTRRPHANGCCAGSCSLGRIQRWDKYPKDSDALILFLSCLMVAWNDAGNVHGHQKKLRPAPERCACLGMGLTLRVLGSQSGNRGGLAGTADLG